MKLYIQILVGVFLIGIVGADLGINNPNLPKIERETVGITNINATVYNTNSSNFWDALDTPSDISGSEFWYNSTGTSAYSYNETWFARSSTLTVCANNSRDKINCDYVCDGINDEYEINMALDNLSNGGEIKLSEGNYDIWGRINATNSITGQGHNTVLTLNFQPFGDCGLGYSSYFLVYNNTHIKNMRLIGSVNCSSSATSDGIWIIGENVEIKNVYLENFTRYSLFFAGDSNNALAENIRILNCQYGLGYDFRTGEITNGFLFKDSFITNCNRSMYLNLYNSHISNIKIYNSRDYALSGKMYNSTVSGVTALGTNNTFIINSASYNSIFFGNSFGSMDLSGTNNVVFGNVGTVYDNGIGTVLSTGLEGVYQSSIGQTIDLNPEGNISMSLTPLNTTVIGNLTVTDTLKINQMQSPVLNNLFVFDENGAFGG